MSRSAFSRPIVCLPFPESLQKKLGDVGITTYSEVESLCNSLDSVQYLSTEEKEIILSYIDSRKKRFMQFTTALDELRTIQSAWKDISTNCKGVDDLLGGGLKCKTITEICGRGATGKTQFCMLMCAGVQRLNTIYSQTKAIFIDTENTFNASRQKELTDALHNNYCILGNIFVFKPKDLPSFQHLLHTISDFLSQHRDVRLVVIDSITYYFREMTDMIKRHEILSSMINDLSAFTTSFQVATVVTNHITSYVNETPEAILNLNSVVQPMLGPVWWHAVTNQLLLARNPQGARLLSVKKSPYLECRTIPFSITSKGFSSEI